MMKYPDALQDAYETNIKIRERRGATGYDVCGAKNFSNTFLASKAENMRELLTLGKKSQTLLS